MNKHLLIFFLCIITTFSAAAQKGYEYVDSTIIYTEKEKQAEPSPSSEDIVGDTTVRFREINLSADTIAAWKNKHVFAWTKNLDSLLAEKNKENQDKVSKVSSTSRSLDSLFLASWIRIILWTIAIAVVAYVLYKLFLSQGLFKGRSRGRGPVAVQATEDELYLQQDFDQLIAQSCKLGEYRIATRYLFLKTLQRLSDRSLIEFAIDKTNSKYVNEIPLEKRNDFAALVLNYEYVWYGNVGIDKDLYISIETKFNTFLNKI